MLKFPKRKRSLALTLALLLSFSLFGCTTEELETAGEIIGTVADIADAVTQEESTEGDQIAEDPEEEMTELPVEDSDLPAEPEQEPEQEEPAPQPIEPEEEEPAIDYDGVYTSKEDVALYLRTYGELPRNFMTKNEARKLGWSGGGLDDYAQDMCIGGDTFGNREGLLPEGDYTECDLNTLGKDSRGAERLVFSDDGRYYHTEDHYESFTEVWIENGEVVSK